MDNRTMARLLSETADLMEIDGSYSFRIRSYRRAADAAEQTTVDLMAAASDAARLLEIDGVDLQACGGTHVANTREVGRLSVAKIRSEGKRNKRVTLAFAQ